MSLTDSPPSYSGSEVFFNDKCPKSTAYHLTLERCKESIMQESGRHASCGFLDDLNIAITIPSNHTWPEVRKQVWSRFQSGWPAILGGAKLDDFALGINMEYLGEDGRIKGRVQLLEHDEAALWDLCKRGSINVVRFHAHCSPYTGVAAGEVRKRRKTSFEELRREGKSRTRTKKGKGKASHRCILQ